MDDFDITCPNCGTRNRFGAQYCRKCGTNLSASEPELVDVPLRAARSTDGASAMSAEITSITDPLLELNPSSSSDLIGVSFQRVLAEAGPRQAEVLRRCAIPRWFDESVLAVLRGRDDGNDRVLELLRDYSFVRPLENNRYTYHDEVRDTLLKEWHAHRSDELHALNLQLAEYFKQRAAKTAPVRTLPKNAVPTTISIVPTGDWDLCQREALYHTLMADPETGMQALRDAFDQAELGHRLGDAEALLQITRNAPLDDSGRLWVRYMRARLERAALRLDTAGHMLEGILEASNINQLLEARVRQALGEVYAETARWVRATEQYRKSREYYEESGRQQEAAQVWLRLGEAYHAMGVSTGGWHVPAYPQNPFWRSLGMAWSWLLSLPFYVVGFFLRRTRFALPRPSYLALYHNWTLTWLYRTAAACYQRALAAFDQLGDDAGMLQAERQLADISQIFGYPDDAIKQLDQTQNRPSAQDPYRRSWLNLVRASALLKQRKIEEARALLHTIRARFGEVGDIRREASACALLSRADVLAGDYDSALDGYENSLAQYRTIRFAVARERVLYDIRALRRQVGPGPISQRISNILAAEPEKRYVARFPRSQLPLLRILSIIAVPLALLMLAIIAPTEAVRQIANLASFQIIFDPLRALWVLMVLVLLYSGAYALVALAVIFFVKLGDLSREQPDYFVTDEQQISRYDYRGALAQQIRWDELRRWVRVDRKLWARPVSLLSSTYLEARDGQDMRIDGITGWYQNVQEDIDLHLKAQGHQVESRDGGFTVLRSKSGASLAVGTLLLVLFISAQNTWAQWLIALLPPQLYAVFSLIAFSGLLMLLPIAYWGAINPLRLRRMLGIRDYWPYAVMLVSAIAIAVGVLQMVPRVPPLNFGLVLVGALTFGYALGVVVAPVQQLLRRLIIAISLLCATSYIGWNVLPTFLQIVSRVGAYQAVLSASEAAPNPNGSWASAQTAIEAAQQIINDPSAAAEQKAQAYINQGLAYDSIRRYDLAVRSYSEALNIYGVMPQSETTQQARATAHYNRYVALFALGQPWQNDLNTACRLYFSVGPDCANPPQ